MATPVTMKAYRISRAPCASSELPHDPFAKLVFEPPIDSDELFDALRDAYRSIKTHTERKKQAVIDFLMEERRAIEQEITAFVQHTGPPVADTPYADPSPSYTVSPSIDPRKSSTSAFSSSASSRSSGSSPETMSLKDMTSVWTAAGHEKPKIHTRRSMTTTEKAEYRKRRQMKACKECRSRKRKCNHEPSDSASSTSKPDSKVKKRTSATTASQPHTQQTSLSNDIDSSIWGESSLIGSTDSPIDFLDFSPAVGTDGSFEDFLLLPNDEFSLDLSTDPLFQQGPSPTQFSYPFADNFLQTPSQQLYAASHDSNSPTLTHQSSSMSRAASNALVPQVQSSETSQNWSYDFADALIPHVRQPLVNLDNDWKRSGLPGGRTSGRQSTALRFIQSERTSREDMPHTIASPGVYVGDGAADPSPDLAGGRLASQAGSTKLDTWRSSTEGTRGGITATHTLNAHTPVDLLYDPDVSPNQGMRWTNDGADNNARRDGLVLGTDPSASSRFGEHGRSLARDVVQAAGRVDSPDIDHPGLGGRGETIIPRDGLQVRSGVRTDVRSSENSNVHLGQVTRPVSDAAFIVGRGQTSGRSDQSHPGRTAILRTSGQNAQPAVSAFQTSDGSDRAVTARSMRLETSGQTAERAVDALQPRGQTAHIRVVSASNANRIEPLATSGSSSTTALVAHTRSTALHAADSTSTKAHRRFVHYPPVDILSLVVSLATLLAQTLIGHLVLETVNCFKNATVSDRLISHVPKAYTRVGAWRQERCKVKTAGGGKAVCVALLYPLGQGVAVC